MLYCYRYIGMVDDMQMCIISGSVTMCGITGYWGYARADLALDTFEAFTHTLAHRGPDDFAIEHWPDARLWLGHRRLAIIDLSDRARQPVLLQWAVLDYVQW